MALAQGATRSGGPPASPPEVTLSSISASTPQTQDEGALHRRLAAIKPTFQIFNDNDYAITDLVVGVRPTGTLDGGRQLSWQTSHIRPRLQATVDGVEIPPEMFREVHESVAQRAFAFWVRFKDQRGEEWEAWRDAGTEQSGSQFRPSPLAPANVSLDMRVLDSGERRWRVEIENKGDVPVDQVECVLPADAPNWSLLTEELYSYPLPRLKPGDVQRIRLHVYLGGPSSVVATVRGVVNGVTYERQRPLAIF